MFKVRLTAIFRKPGRFEIKNWIQWDDIFVITTFLIQLNSQTFPGGGDSGVPNENQRHIKRLHLKNQIYSNSI